MTSAFFRHITAAEDSASSPSSCSPMMVSHRESVMKPHLLILGGTSEASAVAQAVATEQISAILSYAGRVSRVKPQAVEMRIGGFGGVDGMVEYLHSHQVTHIIDATHPFAAQISQKAMQAAKIAQIRYCALTRPHWQAEPQDSWYHLASLDEAVSWLEHRPALRVMLAIGRQNLGMFESLHQHYFLLRLVDAPASPPLFAKFDMVISRGPFSYGADLALLQRHQINTIICKNSGGTGARAKLDAARQLGLDVVMIDRPAYPKRTEFHELGQVIDWVKNEA